MLNGSVLCNCGIKAENKLLESVAACYDSNTKLMMYFTTNIALTNYISQFNLTEELEAPTITNETILKYTLPIFLNGSMFDDTLLSAPLTLKEYINRYKHDSEIIDLKEGQDIDELDIEFAKKFLY